MEVGISVVDARKLGCILYIHGDIEILSDLRKKSGCALLYFLLIVICILFFGAASYLMLVAVGISGTYSNQKLLGFMLVAVPENARDETTTMGTFQVGKQKHVSNTILGCSQCFNSLC